MNLSIGIIILKIEKDKDTRTIINAIEIVGENEYFLLFLEYIQ